MKIVKLEVDQETAQRVLADFEKQISAAIRTRAELAAQISALEESAKSLRAQLGNGASDRKPTGENKSRIAEYLKSVGEKGARMSDIKKATGISISSINFTLKNNPLMFGKRKKLWKLTPVGGNENLGLGARQTPS